MKAKGRQAVLKTYLEQPACESSSECWRIGTLSDIAEVNPKTKTDHLDENSSVTFLPMECVNEDGRILKRLIRPFAEVKNGFPYFQPGDVLFPKITPCMENGKGAIASELVNGVGFGSTEFFILRSKKGVSAEFVYQVTRSPSFRKIAVRYMSGSAGQQRVQRDIFFSHRIPLPPLPEQQRIATVLATVDEAIAATGRVIEIAVELKKELLNCVFRPEFWRVRSTIHAIDSDSWRLIKIDDIKAEKRNAISLGPFGSDLTSEFYEVSGVPVLRGKNLSTMKVNFENLVYVSESKADELRSSNVFPNDIIITYRGTLGQVSLLQNPVPWHRCVISQSLMKISCNERIVNPEYILQYLKSPAGQQKILSYKGHTGVPALGNPITSIKQLQVPLPSLPQQDHIVEILATVDDRLATEQNERDRLVTLKKGLMQVLLTGRVRVPSGVAEEVAPAHV